MNWLQRHWDARAATNFILGGAGSGLMVASALVAYRARLPIALALVLIATGLGAVWLEIGRKLRAVNVFFNPFTSWMTRESFAAALVFALGLAALASDEPAFVYGAAAAAAAFLYCQARILRAARGIPAWRAPETVPLIVASGIAEGAGLALLFVVVYPLLAAFALALVARLIAWRRYRAAVPAAPLEGAGATLLWLGTVAPLVLLLGAGLSPLVAPLAGLAAFAAGAWLKLALVTRASFNQGYALPHLPVRGAR